MDFFRGIAIIIMVLFHLLFDLNEFYNVPINYEQGLIYYSGKLAASIFIFISGISCTLSKNNLKRGLILLMIALVITIITAYAVPGSNIFFGILHFLGVSILLYSIIKNINPSFLFILGGIIILGGQYKNQLTMPNNLLAPVGLLGEPFYSMDYYPLIPWFGLFLLGVALGKLVYKEKKSLFKMDFTKSYLVYLGQHSLLIYLIHQPLLLGILYLLMSIL
ncbi:heparan-alpha-glucosaminide N-acetyltransferase [Desulforamulus aquiferis]|uniref:Heparan-alpha-glucosaminide N-acetyltransferase n=1 Tax=Desulforamulus aquiferis TaxID=1397668 RepID=A0AAW7ZE70_9FIRM|nr:heparan-alpha-glucosaminide N-acetyltransferase [Desulforamulus aquiferis]MDO7787662.1 heparan-alpha-glucosaminide N-acetyltransferase [Desulforamulus aquiferis]